MTVPLWGVVGAKSPLVVYVGHLDTSSLTPRRPEGSVKLPGLVCDQSTIDNPLVLAAYCLVPVAYCSSVKRSPRALLRCMARLRPFRAHRCRSIDNRKLAIGNPVGPRQYQTKPITNS